MVLLLATAFLAAGANTGANLLFVLGGVLLGAVAVNAILAPLTARRVTASLHVPAALERGRAGTLELEVQPVGAGTGLRGWIEVPLPECARPRSFAAHLDGVTEPARASALVSFARTGAWPVERLIAESRAPFGLTSARRSLPCDATVVVLPPLRPLAPATLEGIAAGARGGLAVARDALRWLRDHRAGDDSRSIHWRASARRGGLVVKEYERPGSRESLVVVDLAGAAGDDAVDAARILAASLVADRVGARERVGLAIAGAACCVLHPSDAPERVEAARAALARIEPAARPGHGDLVRACAGLLGRCRVLWVSTRTASLPPGAAGQGFLVTGDADLGAWLQEARR